MTDAESAFLLIQLEKTLEKHEVLPENRLRIRYDFVLALAVVEGILDTPQERLVRIWPWYVAIVAFDFNDRKTLAELLLQEPVPHEFLPTVADIIAGKRKPNLKAAAKLKIPPVERMKVAVSQYHYVKMLRSLRQPQVVERFADNKGIEPIEAKRDIERFTKAALGLVAEKTGLSIETLEDLRRDMEERLSHWPVV